MSRLNVFENIKVDDVISISLDASAVTGEPMVCVETHSQGEIQQKITEGFQIHIVNEFLRSLNLMKAKDIMFITYKQYGDLISHCNQYNHVRKIMEDVSRKTYDDIGILAEDVCLCLLAKYHVMFEQLDSTIQQRVSRKWVKDAIKFLK